MFPSATLPGLLLLLLLSGCASEKKDAAHAAEKMATPVAPTAVTTADTVTLPPDAPQIARLKIEPVLVESVAADEVSAPGNLETNPNRVAHATLPVAGRIASVAVKLGDAVSEGQPLLTVESPEVDAAELAVRQAEGSLSQAKTMEVKAQQDLDRHADLFAHQAVPKKDVLAAENGLALAKTSVQQAEATRLQTLRRLEILGLKPGTFGQKLTVRAPLSGKVMAVSVVAGEYRNDLSVPLMTIADLGTLWVASNVPESYIRHCRIGGAVTIELVAFPGEVFHGRVSHIADAVDAETRTVKVRAEIANPAQRFRPEMFGRINYGQQFEKRPIVPESAIVQYNGRPAVFVEERPGYFVRHFVTISKHMGERAVITGGLKGGERAVTSGAVYLKGGI